MAGLEGQKELEVNSGPDRLGMVERCHRLTGYCFVTRGGFCDCGNTFGIGQKRDPLEMEPFLGGGDSSQPPC